MSADLTFGHGFKSGQATAALTPLRHKSLCNNQLRQAMGTTTRSRRLLRPQGKGKRGSGVGQRSWRNPERQDGSVTPPCVYMVPTRAPSKTAARAGRQSRIVTSLGQADGCVTSSPLSAIIRMRFASLESGGTPQSLTAGSHASKG